MTNCSAQCDLFPGFSRHRIEAKFSGGDVTSDAGVLLLRQVDRKLGLLEAVARALPDARQQGKCEHSQLELLRQRVFALAHGYEDLNDHDRLRHDVALQTALERVRPAASSSTLCRLENRQDREAVWRIHDVLLDQFIASYTRAPRQLILDIDCTDDPVHGEQEGRFFHGYYDEYCFLPLYIFCGERLLTAYLRPSNIDGAKHAGAILKLLIGRLRQAWPKVRIVLRADSGFCRRRLLAWCERNRVDYVIGLARNARLLDGAQHLIKRAGARFERTHRKQRLFGELTYAARTWKCERRVIVKAEHSSKGDNPRFVVTSLQADAQFVYDRMYCARGEMENRIKEQQLGLFADRTSCHAWWANQFRLLLATLAYTLIEAMRRIALRATALARAQASTIRVRLLKLGAIVLRNTRTIRFLLPEAFPLKELFLLTAARLAPG
jgi:hypothetical protein